MYNLDYFSYWKEPIVKIKRIGIYPLDDEGRAKYFSKDSFTHHYLRKCDPSIFNQIIMEKKNNDLEKEKNLKTIDNTNTLNTLSTEKKYESLKTEPNQDTLIDKNQNTFQNNTISSNRRKNNISLNERYINNINKKKNIKLKNINNLRYKSYSKSNKQNMPYTNTEINNKENNNIFVKTFNENNNRKMTQSFDRNAHTTGLRIFKKTINPKLPLIMGGFNHEKDSVIKHIRTGSKEMGENYNPYNFIVPHVNRTKRNYVGGLFHC